MYDRNEVIEFAEAIVKGILYLDQIEQSEHWKRNVKAARFAPGAFNKVADAEKNYIDQDTEESFINLANSILMAEKYIDNKSDRTSTKKQKKIENQQKELDAAIATLIDGAKKFRSDLEQPAELQQSPVTISFEIKPETKKDKKNKKNTNTAVITAGFRVAKKTGELALAANELKTALKDKEPNPKNSTNITGKKNELKEKLNQIKDPMREARIKIFNPIFAHKDSEEAFTILKQQINNLKTDTRRHTFFDNRQDKMDLLKPLVDALEDAESLEEVKKIMSEFKEDSKKYNTLNRGRNITTIVLGGITFGAFRTTTAAIFDNLYDIVDGLELAEPTADTNNSKGM